MTDIVTSIVLDDSGYQAAAKRVSAANANMAGSQDKIGPSTTRAAQSFERLRRSLDPVYDGQKKLERATRDADAAIRAGIATVDDKARVLAKLQGSLTPATEGLRGFGAVAGEVKSSIAGLAGQTGILGTALATIGPTGLVAAAAIGGIIARAAQVTDHFDQIADSNTDTGELSFNSEGQGAVIQLTVDDAWVLCQALSRFIAAQYLLGSIPTRGRA